MPSKKKKYNARFPAGRIKKIMQTDEEVGKVAQAVPVIISRTLELFVESLLKKTVEITNAKNAKTLTPSHMKQCILSESRFDFLADLVKNIPDSVNEDDELNNINPALSRRRASVETSLPNSSKPAPAVSASSADSHHNHVSQQSCVTSSLASGTSLSHQSPSVQTVHHSPLSSAPQPLNLHISYPSSQSTPQSNHNTVQIAALGGIRRGRPPGRPPGNNHHSTPLGFPVSATGRSHLSSSQLNNHSGKPAPQINISVPGDTSSHTFPICVPGDSAPSICVTVPATNHLASAVPNNHPSVQIVRSSAPDTFSNQIPGSPAPNAFPTFVPTSLVAQMVPSYTPSCASPNLVIDEDYDN